MLFFGKSMHATFLIGVDNSTTSAVQLMPVMFESVVIIVF
jgi:hypothetical protein